VRGRPAVDRAEPRGHRLRTAARPLHALPPHRRAGPGDTAPGAPARAAARPVADALRGAGPRARFLAPPRAHRRAVPALGDRAVQPGGPAPRGAARLDRPAGGESGAEAALGPSCGGTARDSWCARRPGPATDPAFDNKLLAPAIERYDRARTALAAAEDGSRRTTGSVNSPPPSGRSATSWRAAPAPPGTRCGAASTCCAPCPRARTRPTGGPGTAGRSPATGTGSWPASPRSRAATTRSPRRTNSPRASANRPAWRPRRPWTTRW
jgi:hypothetical protein